MKVQIIVHADVPDSFDATEAFKKMDTLLAHEQVAGALGFKSQVSEISEVPDAEGRIAQLRALAEELYRVGFDDLPKAIVPADQAPQDGEPLELRLSLSISRTDFPSAAIEEVLEGLSEFDDGELAAMGPMGVIALFDSYGNPEDEGASPYEIARMAAEGIIQNVNEVSDALEEQARAADGVDDDHEATLDQAESALQETLNGGNSNGNTTH